MNIDELWGKIKIRCLLHFILSRISICCMFLMLLAFFSPLLIELMPEEWGLPTLSFPSSIKLIFLFLFFLIITWYYAEKIYAPIQRIYQEEIVAELLHLHLPECSYSPEDGVSSSALWNAQIIRKYRENYTSDLLVGKYQGTPISRSQVRIVQESGVGDSARSTTKFYGGWYAINLAHPVSPPFILFTNKFPIPLKRTTSLFSKEGRHKISLPDAAITDTFQIYGEDDTQIQSLLSPLIQEKMLQFVKLAGASLLIGFNHKTLYVAITSRRSPFLPSTKNRKQFKEGIDLLDKEIEIIQAICDLAQAI